MCGVRETELGGESAGEDLVGLDPAPGLRHRVVRAEHVAQALEHDGCQGGGHRAFVVAAEVPAAHAVAEVRRGERGELVERGVDASPSVLVGGGSLVEHDPGSGQIVHEALVDLASNRVDVLRMLAQHAGSVVTRDESDVVFLLQGERVQAQPVTTGWREDGWVEVMSGLAAGDQLVVEGAAQLSDNSLVMAANSL